MWLDGALHMSALMVGPGGRGEVLSLVLGSPVAVVLAQRGELGVPLGGVWGRVGWGAYGAEVSRVGE